ncbi:MAG: MFS transporter [Gemmatimonadota bacterium]
MTAEAEDLTGQAPPGIGSLARQRIGWRLLPFIFLLYLVAQLDRVNVSFAILRMSVDLGFSDRVYGLGIAAFYVGYVILEVPGALIVERWSARKWISRIMVSWGIVTIFSGLVQTPGQFYATRFLLGLAEASFFPGMIVYLTHWLRLSDRGRAVAILYSAIPVSSVLGAPLAGWLLRAGWSGIPGWRWLFIVEGVPALILGVITLFYLTDWPREARWLPQDERAWIESELAAEKRAKLGTQRYTIWQAFRDRRVFLLLIPYLLANVGTTSITFWMPTFIKRISGLPTTSVTHLAMISALVGLVGLINGWHSDRTDERRWHTAIPLFCVGVAYLLLIPASGNFPISMTLIALGGGFVYAYYPAFWAIPTMLLSESAAAATFGLINGTGHLGGFFGPFIISWLSDRTHSLLPGFAFIGGCYLLAALLISQLKVRESPDNLGTPGATPGGPRR